MNEAYSRSVGIFNPKRAQPVSIIGCGSIGSFAAETLSKMGINTFHLFDADVVSDVNIGCQRFGWEHIGLPKVEAVKDILVKNSPVKPEDVYTTQAFVEPTTKLPYIPTIIGVDNMAARSIIWKKLRNRVPLIIDGRIGGQVVRIFGVTKDYASMQYYAESLYSDAESSELPCTQRNVCYVANIVQGIMGRMLRNYLTKGVVEKEIVIDVETFMSIITE